MTGLRASGGYRPSGGSLAAARADPRSPGAEPFPAQSAGVAALVFLAIGMTAPGIGFGLWGPPIDGGLRVPPIYPPPWIFWAVWMILYPLMGIATAYVWRERGRNAFAKTALLIFAVHFLVNIAWIPVVQASHRPLTASVVMDFVVDIASVIAAFAYARVSRQALYWLTPYLCWEVFTTTIKVWRLFLNI